MIYSDKQETKDINPLWGLLMIKSKSLKINVSMCTEVVQILYQPEWFWVRHGISLLLVLYIYDQSDGSLNWDLSEWVYSQL